MAGRLNKVIKIIEEGGVAFGPFLTAGLISEAEWISTSPYDFVVWEMEHSPYSGADTEPIGRRGHAPGNAIRYWGVDQPTYFDKADAWPLDPNGDILLCLQCET